MSMIDSLRQDSEAVARLWSSDRETFDVFLTDISGDALPGVPADGCFWYIEELV